MKISVVIPAYNEERCLPETLRRIGASLAASGRASEVIVVDNQSLDGTRRAAEDFGAVVVTEAEHNISAVRNAGARRAGGDVLVFIDADTLVPETLFGKIAAAMEDGACLGGAVAVAYERPGRGWMRLYLAGWKFWGKVFNMKQGAAQFCRRAVFGGLGGYDPTIYVGEDVEFYWRLSRRAAREGGRLHFVEDARVVTSARRFDKMGVWKTLLLTHPAFIRLNWRKRAYWKDWYERAVR